ncbi:MAG: CPBP family intramembrane metalloprotease [Leptospiraceae bacterium]|nr:CPBP family intramembrane metalloprotease [Leptospiraceae bacterium]
MKISIWIARSFIPMILVTILMSFQDDFRTYYPIVPLDKPEIGYVATLKWVLAFEIFYVLAFIATEWFFRGFIIREFESFIGKESILLMVPLYVSIHFGKPFLETISSMFGGFVLGILSYYTGNIRGGVFLHIGIALTMEMMGFYWIRNLS